MSDVFISYSRKDIAFARLIRDALQQSQIDTWIDWERIPVGERWWLEICEAIQNANVFMFIISQNSIGSKVCKEEISQALQNHKRIIPIVVDNLEPETIQEFVPELPQYNWIIFERDHIFRLEENPQADSEKAEDRQLAIPRLPQFAQAFERLSLAIHTDWGWVKYHTQLQLDALRWENTQKDPSYLIRGAELEEAERKLIQPGNKDPQPTSLQADYITESRKEENRQEKKARQRQRIALWAVGIGLVVAVALGLVAWVQRNEAVSQSNIRATAEANALMEAHNRATAEANAVSEAYARATAQVRAEIASTQAVQQKNEAERQAALAISSSLAAQARNYLDNQYDLALLLAAQAVLVSETYAARDSLLTVLQRQPHLDAFLRTPGIFTDMAFNPDGTILAGAYCARSDSLRNCTVYQVQIWDVTTKQPVGEPVSDLKGPLLFTASGKSLIVRRIDGQFALLDIQTRHVTDLPFAHSSYAPNLALSPDGNLLAASGCGSISFPSGLCDGAYLLIWNFADGKLFYQTNDANTYYPNSLAFSPDGKMLVWSSCAEVQIDNNNNQKCARGEIQSWDTHSGEVSRHPIDSETVLSITFSPDGKLLAAGNIMGSIIFYDPTSWEETGRRLSSDGTVERLIFSQDGLTLISSSFGKTIRIWDLGTAKLRETLDLGPNFFSHEAVIVTTQGNMLADSGCYLYDNTGFICQQSIVVLWDIGDQPPLGYAFAQPGNLDWRDVEFISPEGTRLAQAECVETEKINDLNDKCVEGKITIIDTATGLLVGQPIIGLPSEIFSVAFNSNGDQLVSVSCAQRENYLCEQSRIDWWDINSGQPLNASVLYEGWILNILLAPDDKLLYFDGKDDTIERLDLITGQLAREPVQGFGLDEMVFSPDGKILATGGCVEFAQSCKKSEIFFWDAQTLKMLGDPISLAAGDTDVSYMEVRTLRFSPDGERIAIATQDGIRFWDLNQHQFLELVISETNIYHLAFNQEGNVLAVYGRKSGSKGYLVLWDLDKGQPIGSSFQESFADSTQFVFSQDDSMLISSAGIAWDVDPISWQSRACQISNRNLTDTEWKIFLGGKPYQKTCPGLP